jgi:hypothetical protein
VRAGILGPGPHLAGEHVHQHKADGLDVRPLGQPSSIETRPAEARDLESRELDGVLRADQHVLGVESAVDEHEIVGGLEAVGDLEGQSQRALDRQ